MDTKVVVIIAVVVVLVLSLPLLLGNKVNMKNYEEIEMGMTYDQVKGILGSGRTIREYLEEHSEDLPPGASLQAMQRMMDAMNFETYIWERGEDKQVGVYFRGDRVIGKAQNGLAEEPSFEFEGMENLDMPALPGFAP